MTRAFEEQSGDLAKRLGPLFVGTVFQYRLEFGNEGGGHSGRPIQEEWAKGGNLSEFYGPILKEALALEPGRRAEPALAKNGEIAILRVSDTSDIS
jgi:hypothetical protein